MVEDADSKELKEVYARYGLAMYYCQVVEHGMVVAVMVLTQLPRGARGEITLADLDPLEERLYGRTFGALVDQFGAAAPSRHDLALRLQRAGEVRNWLAHDFWRVRIWEVSSREGRRRTLADLHSIIESLGELHRELLTLVKNELARLGIPSHSFDEILRDAERQTLTGEVSGEWADIPGSRDRYRESQENSSDE